MDELELKDYFSILRWRKKYFIYTAAVIFVLSAFFAFNWSNYRSTAMVEIARPEVAAGTVVPSGMSMHDYSESLADSRISHLQQKVMSTASLIEVITKFNLYPGARKNMPVAEVADSMQKKIRLDLVSSTLASPSTAQKASANELSAIAFTLSFDYSNPVIAQQVANELVSRFLDEDLKDRRKGAKETVNFLDAQIKALEKAMEEQEKSIAEFRKANGGKGAESVVFNQQASQSVMFSLQSLDSQITTNEGTLGTLRSQLAGVDPYSRVVGDGQVMTTPSVQLKALKTQYATLSAQYGSSHPDLVKVRNQMHALEKQIGPAKLDSGEIKARIEDVKANIAAAKKSRGKKHPDLAALTKKLTKLESQLKDAKDDDDSGNIINDADNPAYLQIVAQIKSAEEQRKSLSEHKKSLLEQQEKYQTALIQNPEIEQKLASLSRDYDNSQLRYRELKAKKMSADMSETIEQDRSGQRLVIINPPDLPIRTQPSRSMFLMSGFLISILGGLAAVIAAQVISQSVVGARHLEALSGVAPLVIIPHITTQDELNSVDRKRVKSVGVAAVAAVLAGIIFSYTVMPLDVFWAVVTRKLGFS